MFLPSRKYVGAVVLSVLSGALLALAMSGPVLERGLGFLAPVALVPLFVALDLLPSQATPNLKPYMRVTRLTPFGRFLMALGLVWIAGSTFVGMSFSWIVVPILRFFHVSYPAAYVLNMLYCLVCGLYLPILLFPFLLNSARSVRKFAEPFPLWTMVVVATAIEVWFQRLWPWTLGGLVQGSHALEQWISVFGASALTPLVLISSAYVARTVVGAGAGFVRFLLIFSSVALVWLVVWGLGSWRYEVLSSRVAELKKSEIVAIRPNFVPLSHFRFELPSKAENLGKLIALSHAALSERVVATGKPDLVIWPEGVLPEDFLTTPDNLTAVRALSAKTNVPVLLSATEFDAAEIASHGMEQARALNSAFLVRADGSRSESYYQKELVPFLDVAPFSEVAPFLSQAIHDVFPARRFEERQTIMSIPYSPDFRVANLISFDVSSWNFARKMVSRAEVGFFAHQSNGVFVDGTAAMRLMEAMVRLRAIETGRSIVSVSNTEKPVAFDPLGRDISPIVESSSNWSFFLVPVFDSESFRSTFYTDFGNFPLAVATFFALFVLALASFRRAR